MGLVTYLEHDLIHKASWIKCRSRGTLKGEVLTSRNVQTEFWAPNVAKDGPVIRWMEEILHQLIDGLSHYLYGFNHPSGDAGFLPSTVWWYELGMFQGAEPTIVGIYQTCVYTCIYTYIQNQQYVSENGLYPIPALLVRSKRTMIIDHGMFSASRNDRRAVSLWIQSFLIYIKHIPTMYSYYQTRRNIRHWYTILPT